MTPAPAIAAKPRLGAEVLIVLGLSLGQSGVFAIWRLVNLYLSAKPVGSQTVTLNPSASHVNVMDLIYQLLRIGFMVVPVALAVYLLNSSSGRARERLGLVWRKGGPSAWKDVAVGAGLAAGIGIPGLGLYLVARAFGQSVKLNTSGIGGHWWTAVILLLLALANALLEETIVVGYLMTRLEEMRWRVVAIIAVSAVLRGSYHLYQGYPMALGNAAMGIVFALFFLKYRRVGPLIAAHAFLDIVSFVGPEVLPHAWLTSLGLA